MSGIDRDSMMATISDLVAMAPRASGTPGGDAAAEYVANRMRQAGLDEVWIEETPTFAWSVTDHSLTIDGTAITCRAINHCAVADGEQTGDLGTGPEGITAQIVDIGAGKVTDFDVRGKIVLFDLAFTMTAASLLPLSWYIHDPDRGLLRRDVLKSVNPYVTSLTTVMTAASQAGAVGVIGVLRDYPESVNYHNEYYRRTPLALPGVWITKDTGQRLRASGASQAHLTVHVRRREVAAKTVCGLLRGAKRPKDAIMIQSHHDSVGPGAVEDGTGVAEVIALAEHYGRLAATGVRRDSSLLFTTFDSHFTGYHAHQAFARTYLLADNPPLNIRLNLTIEHVGLRAVKGADGGFESTGTTEPRAIFENLSPRMKLALVRTIRRHRLHTTAVVNAAVLEYGRMGIPTDASFVLTSGVPTASLVSGPMYLYDDADTEEWVDVDQLEPVARAFIELTDTADRLPPTRLGLLPQRVRERLPRGRW